MKNSALKSAIRFGNRNEYKERVLDYWRAIYHDFLNDYVWLIVEHKVTKEQIATIVFALKNAYPYISPSEFAELIKMYGDMKSGITGMLGKYPFS